MFKQWFNKNKTNEINDPNVICSVHINLTTQGVVDTELFWPDLKHLSRNEILQIATNYSMLLYDVSSGNIRQAIFDALASIEQTSEDYYFVQKIISNMLVYSKINTVDQNDLVVHPTNVFKK